MVTDPNIILSGNRMAQPRLPDVNAMMQTRTAGMENIYAIEQARAEQQRTAQKEQAAAQEAATLKALLPAYTYGIQTGDIAGVGNLVPPEMRPQIQQYIDALTGKSPEEVKSALIGSLSSSQAGQEALAAIQRAETIGVQRGQLGVSQQRLAFDQSQAGMPKPMTAAEQAGIDLDERRVRIAEENAAREAAAAGPGGVKLGPGERATPEGTVELIPGTKAYNAAAKAHTSDKKDAAIVVDKITAAKDKLKYILSKENKDGFDYNFGGYYAAYVGQNMPTDAAQNMYAKLESLKADLKAAGLEQLRAGGSIGQITEAEWPIIEKQMDSITPYMGEQAARDAMVNIQRRLDNIAERATEAYDMQWGDTQFYSPVKAKDTGGGGSGDGGGGGGNVREGATATNPQTGERIIYRNGKWQPL
jgi:hypothetical protein